MQLVSWLTELMYIWTFLCSMSRVMVGFWSDDIS